MNYNSNGEVRLMTLRQIEEATSLKKSAIYDLVRNHKFPANHAVAGRRRAWLSDEIQEFIRGRRDWAPRTMVERLSVPQTLDQHYRSVMARWTSLLGEPTPAA